MKRSNLILTALVALLLLAVAGTVMAGGRGGGGGRGDDDRGDDCRGRGHDCDDDDKPDHCTDGRGRDGDKNPHCDDGGHDDDDCDNERRGGHGGGHGGGHDDCDDDDDDECEEEVAFRRGGGHGGGHGDDDECEEPTEPGTPPVTVVVPAPAGKAAPKPNPFGATELVLIGAIGDNMDDRYAASWVSPLNGAGEPGPDDGNNPVWRTAGFDGDLSFIFGYNDQPKPILGYATLSNGAVVPFYIRIGVWDENGNRIYEAIGYPDPNCPAANCPLGVATFAPLDVYASNGYDKRVPMPDPLVVISVAAP